MMKFLRRTVFIILCVLLSFQSIALAGDNSVKLYVNDTFYISKAPPVIYNGRTMVPADRLLEALDITTYWVSPTNTVYFYSKNKVLEMKLNNYTAKLNLNEINIDAPAMQFNDQIYIPLRFVCESFGLSINWNEKNSTVQIFYPQFDGDLSNLPDDIIPDDTGNDTEVPWQPPAAAVGTPIIAPPSATLAQAQAWARKRGASETFINLAPLFWQLSSNSGVDPAVAYAQSAKETAFGRFGGVLDESYNNPCGMKTSQGGGDYDPNAHTRFSSWEAGISAQLDHLALYAGAQGYPKADTNDPRHFAFILGNAPTVEELGGRWAPSPDYGNSIVNNYLLDLRSMPG